MNSLLLTGSNQMNTTGDELELTDMISENKVGELSSASSVKLNDLSGLQTLAREKKSELLDNQTKKYVFDETKNDRADVYIKNILMKFDMTKTLKIFEQEFFEMVAKRKLNPEEISRVPHIYKLSEIYQEEIGNIQKELDDAKISREKALSLHNRLNKAKEVEKIKHRRAQQEKQKLIKDIIKLKKIFETDNKEYKALEKKYKDITIKTVHKQREISSNQIKLNNLNFKYEKLVEKLKEEKSKKESKFLFF